MFAVDTGYQEGVEILLNAGANVNLQDSNGYTALHAAAQNRHFKIVELLLASTLVPKPQLPAMMVLHHLTMLWMVVMMMCVSY